VVQSIRRDGGSISDVIAGVWPYVVMMLGFTVLLWFVPQIVLWLPQQMF
jgi:TRAP-type C4-dicarboxylate transport system permease large subunit